MLAILSKNFSHNLFFVILSLTNEPSKTGHVTRGPPVCVVLHVLVALPVLVVFPVLVVVLQVLVVMPVLVVLPVLETLMVVSVLQL